MNIFRRSVDKSVYDIVTMLIRLVRLFRLVRSREFHSPDFEASIFNPTELHQIFRCRTICLMLSVSVATRTESLVNSSSPTCESFVFDRALSLRLTEQLSIYASLWSWSLFIYLSVGNFWGDSIQFFVHYWTVVPVTFNLQLKKQNKK